MRKGRLVVQRVVSTASGAGGDLAFNRHGFVVIIVAALFYLYSTLGSLIVAAGDIRRLTIAGAFLG